MTMVTEQSDTLQKVVRNGKVAIVHTNDHGLGWYTWNKGHKELLYHPKLVEAIEKGEQGRINTEWMQANLGFDIITTDAKNLTVTWLPLGTMFMVNDYDGKEILITPSDLSLTA